MSVVVTQSLANQLLANPDGLAVQGLASQGGDQILKPTADSTLIRVDSTNYTMDNG